jgi:hypothetical protein
VVATQAADLGGIESSVGLLSAVAALDNDVPCTVCPPAVPEAVTEATSKAVVHRVHRHRP